MDVGTFSFDLWNATITACFWLQRVQKSGGEMFMR